MKKDNQQESRNAAVRQGRSLILFAIAILIVLGLVFGGWGTVYAAQDAQPDDLLYPVKVAADYLADLTATVSGNDEAPGLKKVISIQKTDRDMDAISDDGLQAMYRHRIGAPEAVIVESLADDIDLPIDETLATTNMMTMTREMSGTLTMTQWMSGTLSMTREMSGTLYGPGQCVGDIDNCPPEIDIPLGYTHTNTSGLEAPYEYKGDVDQQPVIEQPDPALGFGPGEPSAEEVKEPVGNTSSGNSGATDTEQKKGGK